LDMIRAASSHLCGLDFRSRRPQSVYRGTIAGRTFLAGGKCCPDPATIHCCRAPTCARGCGGFWRNGQLSTGLTLRPSRRAVVVARHLPLPPAHGPERCAPLHCLRSTKPRRNERVRPVQQRVGSPRVGIGRPSSRRAGWGGSGEQSMEVIPLPPMCCGPWIPSWY